MRFISGFLCSTAYGGANGRAYGEQSNATNPKDEDDEAKVAVRLPLIIELMLRFDAAFLFSVVEESMGMKAADEEEDEE